MCVQLDEIGAPDFELLGIGSSGVLEDNQLHGLRADDDDNILT